MFARSLFPLLSMTLALCACTTTPGAGGRVTTGTPGTTAVGGAVAGSTSVDADSGLERCNTPLGTLAFDDGRGKSWYGSYGRSSQVTRVESLIRLAVQQSNCFVITTLGNNRTEDKVSGIADKQRNSGDFRPGSNQQKGQRVAADYFMEPAVVINDSPTGRVAGAIGGLIGSGGTTIASSMEGKASVVTLTLYDIRSGVQLAAAEGNATATNIGAALGGFGRHAAGTLGGYTQTPEGKATVAAFTDAYNRLVVALRHYKAQNVEGGLGRGGNLPVN